MTFSTYINGVPSSANVGDTIVARIKPLCMNQTTAYVSYGTGSRRADESRDEITREVPYSKAATCDEEFEFSFVVTGAMEQSQRDGRQNGVYATEDGDITTAYFSVASPDAIMGRVRIARAVNCRSSGEDYIASWYYDEYYNGVMTESYDDFGDGYANPQCRVFDGYNATFFRDYMGYCRKSIYDSKTHEEKDWLDNNTIVVPNDWTPMDGLPDPCTGVICDNECLDGDLYESSCVEGYCTLGNIIEENSEICPGYVPPSTDSDIIEMISDNKEIVIIGAIAGALLLR